MYLQLIDKCVNYEAFTPKQRKLLTSWKQQIQKICHPFPHKYTLDIKPKKNWVNTFPMSTNLSVRTGSQRVMRNPQKPTAAGLSQWSFGSKRSSVGGGSTCSGHIPLNRKNSFGTSMISQPSLLEPAKPVVTKTQSAPNQSSQIGLVSLSRPGTELDTEINARLDSLCLSMTEIALGGISDSLSSGGQWTELKQKMPQQHQGVATPPPPPPPPPLTPPPAQIE